MIQKVNRPPHLALLKPAKTLENDPGSSQGSGMAYDGPPQRHQAEAEKPKAVDALQAAHELEPKEKPTAVALSDSPGMTEVVLEFYQNRKQAPEVSEGQRPGITTRYSNDASVAKGMLLNRKVE